jgi:hypothetical protein
MPKKGKLFNLAYLMAFILPSLPRSPNPPGTIIPFISLKKFVKFKF